MARKARVVSIDFDARTAKFLTGLRDAQGELRNFGREGVSNIQATSGALRVLEGNMNNNLRAAERFLSNVLGLGPALQTIFPIVGGIAMAGLLGELAEKVVKFYRELRDGAEKAGMAFRDNNLSLQITNDGLRVSNDRLEEQIAKLEGHHENTLKRVLDEACESADKLAQSLDKDIQSMLKLLEENKTSIWEQFFGQLSDKGLREELGGQSGSGGFRGQIAEITDEGRAKIEAATNEKEATAARKELDARLRKAYADMIAVIEQQIKDATPALPVTGREGKTPAYVSTIVPITSGPALASYSAKLLEELRGVKRQLQEESTFVGLDSKGLSLNQQLAKGQAASDNSRMDRPFTDRLKKLDEELTVAKTKFEAIGKPEGVALALKAFEETAKAVEEVNKALERYHKTLTPAEREQIHHAETLLVAAQAADDWRQKMVAADQASQERIASLDQLTAAIGRGYEATRQANVETKVMQELGTHAFDSVWMAEHTAQVFAIRAQAMREVDAEHAHSEAESLDKLHDQIEAERALIAAQKDGAEAVRLAALASKVRLLEDKGATLELVAAEKDLAQAQKDNASAAAIAKIDERIAAVKRLIVATLDGAEAERKAGLESKYAQMQFAGAPPEQIAKQRQEDDLTRQQEVLKSAVKPGQEPFDRLDQIDRELTKLREVRGEAANRLAIDLSIRDLEQERLALLVRESLELRRATDGVRAFFIEMQEQAKSSAAIIYDALNSALDKSSANLAKLLTGQKTEWAKEFKSLGEEVIQQQIHVQLQHGLATVGKLFGVDLGGNTKPDGTRNNPMWVQLAGGVPGLVGPQLPGTASTPQTAGGFPSILRLPVPQSQPPIFSGGENSGLGPIFNFSQGGSTEDRNKPSGLQNNPFWIDFANPGVLQGEGQPTPEASTAAAKHELLLGGDNEQPETQRNIRSLLDFLRPQPHTPDGSQGNPFWTRQSGGVREKSVGDVLNEIPHFAEGGTVTEPTLAILGEGYKKEHVVPNESIGAFLANMIQNKPPANLPVLSGPQMGIGEGLLGVAGSLASGPLAPVMMLDWMQREKNAVDPKWQADLAKWGPRMEGMVPTPRNLGEFTAMREAYRETLLNNGLSDKAAEALSFMLARYPNRMAVPSRISEDPYLSAGYPGRAGLMKPSGVFTGKSKVSFDPSIKPTTADVVNTLAHETQHSVDFSRRSLDEWAGMTKGEYYSGDIESGQMAEIRARKAGKTAATAYSKFTEMVSEQSEEPVPFGWSSVPGTTGTFRQRQPIPEHLREAAEKDTKHIYKMPGMLGLLPHFAGGGITQGPTIAGEAGQEAVIPASTFDRLVTTLDHIDASLMLCGCGAGASVPTVAAVSDQGQAKQAERSDKEGRQHSFLHSLEAAIVSGLSHSRAGKTDGGIFSGGQNNGLGPIFNFGSGTGSRGTGPDITLAGGGTDKPTGERDNPYWVDMANQISPSGPSTLAAIAPGLGAIAGAAAQMWQTHFGGGKAMGGQLDPGTSYEVGEEGPERITMGPQGSTITPAGNTVTNYIDARGADLGAHNRIQRGLEATHRGAVTASVQANIERQKRTPR